MKTKEHGDHTMIVLNSVLWSFVVAFDIQHENTTKSYIMYIYVFKLFVFFVSFFFSLTILICTSYTNIYLGFHRLIESLFVDITIDLPF